MIRNPKLGLIAGNGRFPFLVLDAQGYEVVVAAIKEETSPEDRVLKGCGFKPHRKNPDAFGFSR